MGPIWFEVLVATAGYEAVGQPFLRLWSTRAAGRQGFFAGQLGCLRQNPAASTHTTNTVRLGEGELREEERRPQG